HTRFSRDWSSDVCSSDLEDPDLFQRGRPVGRDRADAPVQLVAEADRLRALEQLDAVEDAAAHVPGPLKGVGSVARDEDRVLVGQIGRASCRERVETWRAG